MIIIKLIIAEKNSLAKNIAKALKVPYSSGTYKNNEFIILAAAGHLLELKNAKDYKKWSEIKNWSDYSLPLIPDPFEIKISKDKNKLYKNIVDMVKDNSVTEIIHWCDPDREGQLIGDEILEHVNNKKKVTRCWHKDENAKSLLKAYNERKDNKEYYNMYQEAKTRAELDWLVGINSTIFSSVKAGTLANMGRVKIPILQYIYDRDMEIKNFKPTPYFSLSNKENIPLMLSEKFTDEDKANSVLSELNSNKGIVTDIQEKDVKKQPKPMFSQTTLQNHMSVLYKWSPDKTLSVTQSVYDKKLITYPRADSEYFSSDEKVDVEEVLNIINDNRTTFKSNASCFNDSKILAHTALRPTINTDTSDLTKDELLIYNIIKNRFLSHFTIEDRIISEKVITINVGKYTFKLKGETLKQEGYGVFEPENLSNNLPDVNVGYEFLVKFTKSKKMTKPAPKITIKALNVFMENPFKKVNVDNDAEIDSDDIEIENTDEDIKNSKLGIKIGTTATRPTIIKSLITGGYLSISGKNYSVTDKGIWLIELKNKLGVKVNKEQTIEMEQWLTEIGNGSKKPSEIKDLIIKRIKELTTSDVEIEKVKGNSFNMKEVGTCPNCSGKIVEKKWKDGNITWQCENVYPDKTCDFSFNQVQKFPNHKVTEKEFKTLLDGKTIIVETTSKEGKPYKANFKLEKNGNYYNLKLDSFVNSKKE